MEQSGSHHDGRFRVDGIGSAFGPRRGLGSCACFAPSRRLPRLATGQAATVLRAPGFPLRPRPRARAAGRRRFPAGTRLDGGSPSACGRRAASSRVDPANESRSARDKPARCHARGPARRDERRPVAGRRGRRFPASVRFLVQPGLPRASPDRLVDPGSYPRQDHPVRSRSRDHELGRPEASARTGRSSLLRVLPPGTQGRALDLRRGRADHRRAAGDRAAT